MRVRGSLALRMHLRFLQWLGLFDMSLSADTRRQRISECLLKFWSLTLFLSLSALTVYTFMSDDDFFFKNDQFGYFNDVLKVSFAQLSITIVYLETVFRTKAHHCFWKLYNRLHEQFDRAEYLTNRVCGRFLCIFYGFVVLDFLASLLFILLQNSVPISRHVKLFSFMFMPYMYVVHYRCMQFVLHIELLRHELIMLKQDLGLLADYTLYAQRVGVFEGFEEFLRCKLRDKQFVYQHIYEMVHSFQRAFGCSILAVLLMVYVRVLVDAYFTYYITYRGWSLVDNIFIVPALFQIPTFLITSMNCMSVVKHITHQLHSIRSPNNGGVLSKQIQNFSLQILHAQIRIDGMGIGNMDGYMLTRIVGSITTYMVFFIQFMPKFQTL